MVIRNLELIVALLCYRYSCPLSYLGVQGRMTRLVVQAADETEKGLMRDNNTDDPILTRDYKFQSLAHTRMIYYRLPPGANTIR